MQYIIWQIITLAVFIVHYKAKEFTQILQLIQILFFIKPKSSVNLEYFELFIAKNFEIIAHIDGFELLKVPFEQDQF